MQMQRQMPNAHSSMLSFQMLLFMGKKKHWMSLGADGGVSTQNRGAQKQAQVTVEAVPGSEMVQASLAGAFVALRDGFAVLRGARNGRRKWVWNPPRFFWGTPRPFLEGKPRRKNTNNSGGGPTTRHAHMCPVIDVLLANTGKFKT